MRRKLMPFITHFCTEPIPDYLLHQIDLFVPPLSESLFWPQLQFRHPWPLWISEDWLTDQEELLWLLGFALFVDQGSHLLLCFLLDISSNTRNDGWWCTLQIYWLFSKILNNRMRAPSMTAMMTRNTTMAIMTRTKQRRRWCHSNDMTAMMTRKTMTAINDETKKKTIAQWPMTAVIMTKQQQPQWH